MTEETIRKRLRDIGVFPFKVDQLLERYSADYLTPYIWAIDNLLSYQAAADKGFLAAHLCAEIRRNNRPAGAQK